MEINTKAFEENSDVKYKRGGYYKEKNIDLFNIDIYWNIDKSFNARFMNIFEKYLVTINSQNDFDRWINKNNRNEYDNYGNKIVQEENDKHPMQFWQWQLNFAIWCATAGCGVSYNDHMKNSKPLTKSFFQFHVYYQIRRILKEMQVALPKDPSFNANNNTYNKRKYNNICDEFNIPYDIFWGPQHENNYGMGEMTIIEKHTHGNNQSNPKVTITKYKSKMFFNPKKFTFENINPKYVKWHAGDYITQAVGRWVIDKAKKQVETIKQKKAHWSTFILDNSNGFTPAGMVRINESIRSFVYCLLGSQTTMDQDISKLDVQHEFINLVIDCINTPVDPPESVKRYKQHLNDARSQLDYIYGYGLYLAPSDMTVTFTPGLYHNNLIMKADKTMNLGLNKKNK